MKRLRDEVFLNSQSKRQFASSSSSRGESYGPSHAPLGGGGGVVGGDVIGGRVNGTGVGFGSARKLTTNDALTYLKEVKDMFQDRKDKYDKFLDVMKDFKAQRIKTAGVIVRVKELFKGHPNLILGFNTFLPKGNQITFIGDEVAPSKRTVEFEEAISFVNKIKKRFRNNDHVYKTFLDTLNLYRKEHKGITEVYQEVAVLFGGHSDLLDEFTRFLPDVSSTVPASLTSLGRHSVQSHDEQSSAVPAVQQFHLDKQWPLKDMNNAPHGEHDHIDDRTDMDTNKTVIKLRNEQENHTEKENRDNRSHDEDVKYPQTEINGEISVRRHSERNKPALKLEDLGGHSNLASCDHKDVSKSMNSNEVTFCEKVKERLHSEDDYQAFLKCLHIYSTEIITRKELQSLVADLLGKYPDLLVTFNELLECSERIDGFLADVMGKKTLLNEGSSSKALRIEDKDKEQKCEVEGGKEKDRCSLKYWGKSINELDLSNCESCTPSYRLLPDDYPIPLASQRSELGAQVLNDHWVSVASGSEDYSFEQMRKNQYEESLFRCEDDRFELDMLLESISSTVKRAEELLNCINNNTTGTDNSLRSEDYFTALNFRCIERLYGDHCLDVIDMLRKNPSLALPVVLTRLKQKQEEWTKCCSGFNKVWVEVYSKNHYKSLDHRSFYFKQEDSKNLSTKSLVAEIKEVREQKLKDDDDVLLSIIAGNRHPIIPNLEYVYADTEVHEDVYKIIKFSSEEMCSTKEQLNKILRFWTNFFEPMLGVHFRLYGSKATEEDRVIKCQKINTTASIIETEGSPEANAAALKQLIPNCNGESNLSPQWRNGVGFTNMGALVREVPNIVSSERLTISDIAVASGPDANHGYFANSLRVNNVLLEEISGTKPTREDILSSEGGETSRMNQLTNGKIMQGSRLARYNEASVDSCKNEKEEGELSPNGDFEENFGLYQNVFSQGLPEKNCDNDWMQCQPRSHEDADDEDSENISEAGEDASGSDSAADDCSQGEHEEDEGEHHDLDDLADWESNAKITSETHYSGGMVASVPQAERGLLGCKPLSKHVSSLLVGDEKKARLLGCKPLSKHVSSLLVGDEKKARRVFYGNDTFYALFRLHQTLYERILSAKLNTLTADSKCKNNKDECCNPYTRFMNALFSLLDGSSDNTTYEDDCRSLLGNQSYVLFTLDKLIYKLVKQLQNVSTEEVDCKLVQLYEYEKSRNPEKFVDSVYYENVHILLHDENIYRFESASSPTRLSVQMIDDGNEKSNAVVVSLDPNFATYLHNDYLLNVHWKKESSALILKRNLSKYYANHNESMATNKCLIMNGLECKMEAASSKIIYVLDTEDFFIRARRRMGSRSAGRFSYKNQARVQRFHQFLSASL